MDWWLLGFFIGAIFSLFLPAVPAIFILFILAMLAVALFLYKPLRVTSGFFMAFTWLLFNGFQYQAIWHENNLTPNKIAESTQLVEGNIISLPSQANNVYRFNLNIFKLNNVILKQSFNSRVRWDNPTFLLNKGQKVQLVVSLKPAHGLANPGGFSYQTWLREKNIAATGYVKKSTNNLLLINDENVRQLLYEKFIKNLPNDSLSSLLLALSFAERSQITPEIWQVLQVTGTQHLIAISGLHLGLVASGSFVFMLLFIRLLPLNKLFSQKMQGYLLAMNVRSFALIFSLLLTLFYGYLADFSLPTLRALVMLFLYWLTRYLGLKLSLKRWLLMTLFIIILIDPFALFSSSFWMSFYAVTLIFLTLWRFSFQFHDDFRPWRVIKSLFIIQLSLTLFLLPLSAIFYQKVSIASFFANLIAVPLMSFITIPLALFSVVVLEINESFSSVLMIMALQSIHWLWWWLSFLSEQSFALITLSNKQTYLLVLIVFSIGLTCFLSATMLMSKFRATLVTTCLVSIVMLLFQSLNQNSDLNNNSNWQVNVLDVGQGLAVVIEKNGHAILYDTGASFPSGFNLAESVILPYLEYYGIKKVDKVILSHSDNDHAGGFDFLQKNLVIDEVIANHLVNDSQQRLVQTCLQGQKFHWQGLVFTQLWPDKESGDNNDDSCVININDGLNSILLTGDISKLVEGKLINTYQNAGENFLDTDVLVAPHHGSKTSSSDPFIHEVSPKIAIFSSGYFNRWHMPASDVVNRYDVKQIKTFNTATSGMVRIISTKQGIIAQEYRRDIWPYWFAN